MTEDWLPQPPPPQPVANRAKRTLLLWVVLIALFILIYNFIDATPHHGQQPPPPPAGYSGWWIWIAALAGLVPLAYVLWQFGHSTEFNALQTPALEALADSKYSEAAKLFGALAQRFKMRAQLRSVAAFNQGYALIRCGEAAAAVGALLWVERSPSLQRGGVRQLAAIELARAFAIGGDLDKARRWITSARERPAGTADPTNAAARLEATELLLLCREGKHDEAVRLCEQQWPRFESHLAITQMREVWLLRAFAVAATTGPRDGGTVDAWLGFLRGAPAGSLAWLTERWPELAAFAATHSVRV